MYDSRRPSHHPVYEAARGGWRACVLGVRECCTMETRQVVQRHPPRCLHLELRPRGTTIDALQVLAAHARRSCVLEFGLLVRYHSPCYVRVEIHRHAGDCPNCCAVVETSLALACRVVGIRRLARRALVARGRSAC